MTKPTCVYCDKELTRYYYVVRIRGALALVCRECRDHWGHKNAKRHHVDDVKEEEKPEEEYDDDYWYTPYPH